jgi:hypothetical protein
MKMPGEAFPRLRLAKFKQCLMKIRHARARCKAPDSSTRRRLIAVVGFPRRRRWLRPFTVNIYRIDQLGAAGGVS